MTHKDIYIKFMIEYDKANVTSSYPSLTEYEVATFLDKAYNAIIAQKMIGNNPRRSVFESDTKSISDLNPIIKRRLLFLGASGSSTKSENIFTKIDDFTYTSNMFDGDSFLFKGDVRSMPDNMRSVKLPSDMLYFVAGAVPVDMHVISGWMNEDTFDAHNKIKPIDNKLSDYESGKYKSIRLDPVRLVSHDVAEKFYATSYNIPWVKNPVCFLEDNKLFLLVDPIAGIPTLRYKNPDTNNFADGEWMSITYVKKPNLFVKDIDNIYKTLTGEKGSKATYVLNNALYPASGEASTYSNILIDRYNSKGDHKIHINEIKFIDPSKITSTSVGVIGAYYIEDTEKTLSLNQFNADEFINQTLQIGSETITTTSIDDSTNIALGSRLLMLAKDDNNRVSKIYSLDYNDLYQYLISNQKISGIDDSWEGTLTIPLSLYKSNITNDANDTSSVSISNLELSYFDYNSDPTVDNAIVDGKTMKDIYTFELNDVVAGELVTLAVSYALENVESARFNNHIQLRGLES